MRQGGDLGDSEGNRGSGRILWEGRPPICSSGWHGLHLSKECSPELGVGACGGAEMGSSSLGPWEPFRGSGRVQWAYGWEKLISL